MGTHFKGNKKEILNHPWLNTMLLKLNSEF